MKIIIDGVFNHVGSTFWAFEDVKRHQERSPYKDWFIVYRWDDPATPQNEFEYQGWYGVKDLPEIRENGQGPAEGFKHHIKAIVHRWMDPNGDGDPSDGIDGWRLDVAEKVSIQFWREFRRWVKSINPEAYITGELFWDDWQQNKLIQPAPWLQGDVFDGVMNYRFAVALKRLIIDTRKPLSVSEFVDSVQALQHGILPSQILWLQNLVDSHDTDRLASQIQNPDRWYDHQANPAQNPKYNVARPDSGGWEKFRLITGLQFLLPGSPMIYYGDEAGMWGGDDPDCRKPMVWPELPYAPEAHHPFGAARPVDPVAFDSSIFHWYQKLIQLRHQFPQLRVGNVQFLDIPNHHRLLIFRRFTGNTPPVLIVCNVGHQPQPIQLLEPYLPESARDRRDLLTGQVINLENSQFLPPWHIWVFLETQNP